MANIPESINEYNNKVLSLIYELFGKETDPFQRKRILMLAQAISERDVAFSDLIKKEMLKAQVGVEGLKSMLNYMSFDLEATRRERDKYQRELEGNADDTG